MSRPIWKGHISFGLVNIPVVLYSGEQKSDINLKLIDSRDKARIRYVRINEQTGQEVAWSDIAKGYEYDTDSYVLITNDELKEIAGDNVKAIAIENFVDKNAIKTIEYETPYYLVPDKKGEKGYVILREVLNKTRKVGIAKVIIHTREYLACLLPYENALVLNLLRYDQELRKPEEFDLPEGGLKDYKINAKELEIASQLVASMASKWQPEQYKDEYRLALEKWIDEKISQERPRSKMKSRVASSGKKDNVINFMSLLKESLANKKTKPKKSKTTRKPANHKMERKRRQAK